MPEMRKYKSSIYVSAFSKEEFDKKFNDAIKSVEDQGLSTDFYYSAANITSAGVEHYHATVWGYEPINLNLKDKK